MVGSANGPKTSRILSCLPSPSSSEPRGLDSTRTHSVFLAARRIRKSIVVDTDVLIAASGTNPSDPRLDRCLDFLESVLSICHRIILTAELEDEWEDHQSRYANRWLSAMESRRKVSRPAAEQDAALRSALAASASSERAAEALAKDAHLLEACRRGDSIVASCDSSARAGFARCTAAINWLGRVVWVDPATEPDLVEWLERGAPLDSERRLSNLESS